MLFCNTFDERLARNGPAGIFLMDREGRLRFDAEWTRDAWERNEGEHQHGESWTLLRDHDTGFVMLALVTSTTLLAKHQRMDVRAFQTLEQALECRESFGHPPIVNTPW
jgi:hypothetical protein